MVQAPDEVTQITGERSAIFGLARGRLSFISTAFLILYILVAARLTDLAVVQGTIMQLGNDYQVEETAPVAAARHNIYDRNGVMLATSLKSTSLFADPALVDDPRAVAQALVQIFPELNAAKIAQKMGADGRFAWIKRDITPQQQAAVLNIGEPGLAFQDERRRVYPQGELAGHMIGYTNVDGQGLGGAELAFNKELAKDDVSLSLDVRLQHVLEKELQATSKEFKAKAASGVIMDIKTGELLAGSSYPAINPNKAGKAEKNNMFNRLTLGVYELGSMFKIFSTAVFLDEVGELATRFDAREPLRSGGFTIRDYHAEKRIMSVPEVFMYSSNIGTALMAEEIGTERLRGFYGDLGLLRPAEIELNEIGAPLVPSPWRHINTLTASYGHGIAVSPLQLASATASVIGDGMYVKPTLLKGGNQQSNVVKQRVVSEATADNLRRLMRLNVVEGTGGKAGVTGYQVGGKTGTAEKPGPNGGYDHDKKISSFVGAFPMDDPQYLVLVVVDEPVGNERTYGYATAGWVAAPATKNIVEGIARVKGIKPANDENIEFVAPLKQYIEEEEDVAHAQ